MNTTLLICATASAALASCADAAGSTASDTAGLLRALRHAPAGAVITLAPGRYAGVAIKDFHGSATITSADPARPAVLSDLTVVASSGLTLKRLEFSTATDPIGPNGPEATIPFQIMRSSNITLTGLNVHGADPGSLATDESGLIILDSDHVTVADSDFHNLHNALGHIRDNFLTIRGNHFHRLRDDGIRGGGSSNVLIANNRCEDNHPDPEDADHPDCIQFWTTGMTTASHDITISGNTYERGAGRAAQGIFLRDESNHLPYERLTITGNVIKGAMYSGISVFGAIDPDIEDNLVCPYHDQQSWILVRQSTGARLARNQAAKYAYLNTTGIKEDHNKLIGECPKQGAP